MWFVADSLDTHTIDSLVSVEFQKQRTLNGSAYPISHCVGSRWLGSDLEPGTLSKTTSVSGAGRESTFKGGKLQHLLGVLQTATQCGAVVCDVLADGVHLVEVGAFGGQGTGSLVDEDGAGHTTAADESASLTADSDVVADGDHLDAVRGFAGGHISFAGEAELEDVAGVGFCDNEHTAKEGKVKSQKEAEATGSAGSFSF